MALAEVRDQLTKQGMIPATSTPDELAALIKSDLARWAKVVSDAKITLD
jgi:tripartite-type tricarboxylate transporter receptor subunit TctC